MHIRLAFDGTEVPVDVPDNWINGRCYRPHPITPCADPYAELITALDAAPEDFHLGRLTEGKKSCVIAVDSEFPELCGETLNYLIEAIEDASHFSPSDITLVVSNRVSERIKEEDLEELLEPQIRNTYRVVLHNPLDPDSLVQLDISNSGVPLTINKVYHEADLKIILGGVYPDMLMGFTGGRAVLMPGLTGKRTIESVYSFSNVTNSNVRYGNFKDNPFHVAGLELMQTTGCDLTVSAMMSPEGKISSIAVGHPGQTHLMMMTKMRQAMKVTVREPMDIVVTSGGGNPLDTSVWRLVSALSSVQPVLKPDGTIVIAASLNEGLGPKRFQRLLDGVTTPQEMMQLFSANSTFLPGQWVCQKLYDILQNHEVIIYSNGLKEDQLWRLGFTPVGDLNEAIQGAMMSHGQRCKIVALPDGPLGIGMLGR